MTTVADLLDPPVARGDEVWYALLETSLRTEGAAWLRAADEGALIETRWWWLLSWVERSASTIAAAGRSDLLELSAFALSLLEDGPVDAREAWLVGALIRRGARHAGLDFLGSIRAGCARAGARGQLCYRWLSQASDELPGTHQEVGQGADFRFERPQSTIDIEALTRWAKGEE